MRKCCFFILVASGVAPALLWQSALWEQAVPRTSLELVMNSSATGNKAPPTEAPAAPTEAPAAPEAQAEVTDTNVTDPPADMPWIFQEQVLDPPGFNAFRQQMEELQNLTRSEDAEWLIFAGGGGLGNWMLAISSAALMAAVMQRTFGVYGGPDLCNWMSSPLCGWKQLPEAIRTKVARKLKNEKEADVDLIVVPWQGCGYKKLCQKITAKKILLVKSGAWFGELFAENPVYSQRMKNAFERRVRDQVILDIYGPVTRWLFSPQPEVKKEMDRYFQEKLSGAVSICLQGRWGEEKEFIAGKNCIEQLFAADWWPKDRPSVIHVASMKESFRKKVAKAFPNVNVSWPDWDQSVTKQMDNRIAYQDMLISGRCNLLLAPIGGSTYTWAATSMYHKVSVRDCGSKDCGHLPDLPYSKLFREPRMQLDLGHKCGETPTCLKVPKR